MARKTYNQKLNASKDMPRVETLTDPAAVARYGGEKMLLAPPLAYDALMKTVPEGSITTSDRIRARLAREHGADFTCPLTAGIFINVAAHASDERGESEPTPWFRTLRKDGELNEKYPGGLENHRALLEAEGHEVVARGKRLFVRDYETKLWQM